VLPYGLLFRERRPGVAIATYHRIGGGTDSDIDLPQALFARQMAYLRRHRALVGMDEVADGMPRGDGDVVAVTFDDGHKELYDHAMPVLQRYRIPVIVYLATDYVERQRPFDFGAYGRSPRPALPLSWVQVREMVSSGLVTVGAHTHRHLDLTRLSPAAVRGEMEHSRRLIEDRVGVPVRHLAYPWGTVTPAVRALAGEFFTTAVRGGCGKNPYGTIDLLALWREPVQQADGFWLFRLKLASYLDGEEFIRQWWTRRRRSGPVPESSPPLPQQGHGAP